MDGRITSLVAVVLALALTAVGYARLSAACFPTSYSEVAQSQQQQASKAQANDKSSRERECILSRTGNDPVALFTAILTLFTALLFFATCGLWYMAVRQAGDMKKSIAVGQKSAEAALKSAQIAERSLLDLEQPYLFMDEPTFKTAGGDWRPQHLRYVVWNHGRTPATIRWLDAIITICEIDGKEIPINWREGFNGNAIVPPGKNKEIEPFRCYEAVPETGLPASKFVRLTIAVHHSDVFGYMNQTTFDFFRKSDGGFNAMADGVKRTRKKDDGNWHPNWADKANAASA